MAGAESAATAIGGLATSVASPPPGSVVSPASMLAWTAGGAAPATTVTGALVACPPRVQTPVARTAADAPSTAAATTSDLRWNRLERGPSTRSRPARAGITAAGRLSETMASLLASSRTSNRPARASSARADSFPARGPGSRAGWWHRSARATRSCRRLSRVASVACRKPHSTGWSPSPWSTCDGSIWPWARPVSCRSATTSASTATPAARSVGSVNGRVAHVYEFTKSVCRARPPSGVSMRSTKRTTPGWSSRRRVSASRSMLRTCAAGTCLTAIRRSPERLTVTLAMVDPPNLDTRCHTTLIEPTS